MAKAGAIGTPRRSRWGRNFMTRGPRSKGPVRILGPGRSIDTRQARSISPEALRTLHAMRSHRPGSS